MALESLCSVFLNTAETESWSRSFPEDFLPSSLEIAEWRQTNDNWFVARFSGAGGRMPARLEDIRSPEDLPPGVVLLRPLSGRVAFSAPVPFGMDLHWLKEVGEGLLRGTTGIRVQSAGAALVRGEWAAEWLTGIAREDAAGEPGLRVAVTRRSARGGGVEAHGGWSIQAQSALLWDPRGVAAALLGVHPLNWVRELIKDLGSRRVEEFVRGAGSTLRAFDTLREFWQGLGAGAEAGFWELLREGAPWGAVAGWLREASGEVAESAPSPAAWIEKAAGHLPARVAGPVLELLANMAGSSGQRQGGTSLLTAAQALLRLLEKDGVEPLLQALPQAAERELNDQAPGEWLRARLEELFGSAAPQSVHSLLQRWPETARKMAAPAAAAVARQWDLRLAAGVSTRKGEAAVADATFRFTDAGLAAAARVAQGDLSPLFEDGGAVLRLRRGLLTETFHRRVFLEVHAPMLRVRRKQRDLESFASAEACPTEDGRLQIRYTAQAADVITADLRTQTALVFSAAISARDGEPRRDHFSLSFTDRRRLDPAVLQAPYLRVLEAYGLRGVALPDKPCAASLHLRLAGSCVEAWTSSPAPGSPEYLPEMSRLATAVQRMVRLWLPALYLARIEAYSRPSAVHPLLAWSCSPPCSGPRKKDLSYDFMDPKVVDAVLQAGSAEFRQRLAETWKFLIDAGRKQTAAYYEPADTRYILASVRRQQKNFVSLLTADAFLVEAVLNAAGCAREVDRLSRVVPKAAVSEMARFSREMAETFHRKLRRLYAGDEFLALGPLFFLTATSALAGGGTDAGEVAAVLTLECEEGKASYANEAAQRLF